jgi:acetolactate synthase-1/2/3 large subunit
MKNVADLFVKALENEGVEYIFGIPGEENLDLLESIRKSNIRLILTRHEQAAGFMAATYGRLTGKAGVCISTLGPGATNLVTAAAYAQLGAMPMVMVTGQKPIKRSKQGQFQIVDVVGMMRPLTKFTHQIVDGANVPSRVREAFRLAEEERPGACHLELPEDIAASPVIGASFFDVHHVRRPTAEKKAIAGAVDLLERSRYPLLLIGAAANRKRTQKALKAFVDKTGIPFFNTQMGKGVIDETHPLFLGTAALSENDYLHCAIKKADLIVNVGHDIVEKPPFVMDHQRPSATQVIHINFSPSSVDEVYFPQHEVIGDIADSLEILTQKVKVGDWDFDYFCKVKEELDLHLLSLSGGSGYPITPQRLVADVRAVMPPDGIVTLDNGMYKIWFARNYRANQPNTLILDNALASMGAGLPSAMVCRLVFPKRRVMAICGDGGFLMNAQEMETAVRLNLDLTILVLNDNAYGMIKWKQTAMGHLAFGLDFSNPDFVTYAESYGAHGHRVESAGQLKEKLNQCLDCPGVHLIDVPIDYRENERILVTELRKRTCRLEE